METKMDFPLSTSEQIEKYLCGQLARIRVARNLSQEKLAKEAGVAIKTIGRMERGEGVSLDTFIRVMKALGLTGHLQVLLPDPAIRPMERIRSNKTERKRSRQHAIADEGATWSWGNEAEKKNNGEQQR